MALLRHLHAWGAVYHEPKETPTEAAALQLPDPPSSAQGVLLLLSCLTKRHSIALKVTRPCVMSPACLNLFAQHFIL